LPRELVERALARHSKVKREAPRRALLAVCSRQAGQGLELRTLRKLFVLSLMAGFGFG
jgi:hypothetical protein